MIKNKPVIGIIPTFNINNPDNDPYLDRAYFVNLYEKMIAEAGGIPVGLLDLDINLYKDLCDGYLWPGGGYVNRYFFGLIEDALNNHKPMLGICLGMQALSIYFNVLEDQKLDPSKSLEDTYQANKETNPYLIKMDEEKVSHHDHYVTYDEESQNRALHNVLINKDSLMYDIYEKDVIQEPSMHTICVNRLPDSILVSAKTSDEVIEAIEIPDSNILGVQYHPELIGDPKLFEWLINKASK